MLKLKKKYWVAWFTVLSCYVVLLLGCDNLHRNKSHPEITNSNIRKGKALAAIYCQSCHALPDPDLIDTKTWEKGVLPQMGPRLGIFSWNNINYPSARGDMNWSRNFYPDKPVVKPEEWKNIMDYYVATSPDTLPGQYRKQVIKNDLSLFKILKPALHYTAPFTSFVKIQSENSLSPVIISDAQKQNIYFLNQQLKAIDSVHTNFGQVVNIDFKPNEIVGCNIGIMNPHNGRFGKAQLISYSNNKRLLNQTPLFEGLQRPVEITSADLNKDGKLDYIVCEFGYLTGALSWMQNMSNNKYRKNIIRPFPGAIKAYINDYNKDGLPDIWVLFAQGEEGVFLFTNKGNGRFEQREVLRFPPVYGSSYFELADFNKDGFEDIVYTCGDNADYSTVLKPYHGVYIFINDGKNNFKQEYFFPINGCYKAIPRDFDGDGDLDLATISFFADYSRQPEEGFVYLENEGNYKFQPYSHPATQVGRWLTMDAGDVNGDGKTDLILGNFSVAPFNRKPVIDWKQGPPFIVLQNIGKKK